MAQRNGTGMFPRAVMNRFPLLPREEEGRLNDMPLHRIWDCPVSWRTVDGGPKALYNERDPLYTTRLFSNAGPPSPGYAADHTERIGATEKPTTLAATMRNARS
jgi:hypothetical protein